MGLVVAAFYILDFKIPTIFSEPTYLAGIVVLAILAAVMVKVPLANAGHPDEPAPPTAMM